MDTQTSRRLKMLGMVLFLLGLLTGLAVMNTKNPRMGLSAHLEGVMNGTFLVVAGFLWSELKLSSGLKKVLFWALVYGTYVNWLSTLLAAVLGTSKTTPIAGAGFAGSELHETIVTAGLVSIALAMVFSLSVIVYGLRGKQEE
jgi:hydroxylaminobenzene mutase